MYDPISSIISYPCTYEFKYINLITFSYTNRSSMELFIDRLLCIFYCYHETLKQQFILRESSALQIKVGYLPWYYIYLPLINNLSRVVMKWCITNEAWPMDFSNTMFGQQLKHNLDFIAKIHNKLIKGQCTVF